MFPQALKEEKTYIFEIKISHEHKYFENKVSCPALYGTPLFVGPN